jgi:hypothetical protein
MASTPKLHHKISLERLSSGRFTPLREVAYGAIVATSTWFVEVAPLGDVRLAAASCRKGVVDIEGDIVFPNSWSEKVSLYVITDSRSRGLGGR